MTQGKHRDGNPPLLPLPAPRSGTALDRKIIDYAKAKAPSRRPQHAPRWYAGMATAAVVVAAVLITLPPQVPAPATRDGRQQSAPGASLPKQAAQKFSHPLEPELQTINPPAAQARTSLADEADTATDTDPEAAAPRAAKESVKALTGQARAPKEPITRDALEQQLAPYRALLQSGAQDQARAGYRQLRLDCPACELPETLEEALSLYPERE